MFNLFLTILLLVATPTSTTKKVYTEKKEVLLVGDSLAEGLYPNLKKDTVKYSITPLYKRGTTVPYWNNNAEFKKAIKTKKWDIILISLGTNDLRTKPSTMTKYVQFNEQLSTAKSSGSEIYWIIPPVMPFKNELMEEWIDNPEPPVQKIVCEGDVERSEDGVHPTQKGYKDWSKCILDSLP